MAPTRLREQDIESAVRLHQHAMDGEFLTGGGRRFLCAYYRTWLASPVSIALAYRGADGDGAVAVLLGSVRPEVHYRTMVRSGGPQLAALLAARAVLHPLWGVSLVRTRARRYARGVLRVLTRSGSGAQPHTPAPRRIAEVTHLMVDEAYRGHGYARALLDEAQKLAVAAQAEAIVVVTRVGWSAERFYEHLGWTRAGEVISASGERFIRYERQL